jgi:hypothetical protein
LAFYPDRKAILLRAFERGAKSKACHSEAAFSRGICFWVSLAALLFPLPIPDVEIIWKSCGKRTLTGYPQHGMFVRFRGQSVSHSCEIAWTEFTPLRRSGDSVFDN